MIGDMQNVNGTAGMAYADLEVPRSAPERNDALVEYVTAFITQSENYNYSSRRRLPELYNAYRNISRGFDHPFRNNVSTNQLFATVEADAARKARAILSGAPVTFDGTPISGGASFARKQQALYYQQEREDGAFLKKYLMMKAAGMYGVAVQRRGWKYDVRSGVDYTFFTSPVDGKRYRIGKPNRKPVFDGPTSEMIDLLDFWGEPGKGLIRHMRRAASRDWLDLDAVEELVESGELPNRAEFDRLKQSGGVSSDMYSDLRNQRGIDSITGNPKNYSPYARPVELIDFVGYVPKELAKDGISFRRVIIANKMFTLLDEPFPWSHGRIDFVFQAYAPFADPHFFYAPGKIEVGLALQRAQNKFVNQALDVGDIAGSPPTFINEDLLVDPRGTQIKAGKIIKVRGNPGEGVMSYTIPLQGAQYIMAASDAMGTMIQRGTGLLDDVGQGLPSNPRETARGVLARSEAAGTRADSEIMLGEEMWLCPDAEAVLELDRQFLSESKQAELLGDMAVMDPITGGTNQFPAGTMVQVNPEDIAVRLRARAVGTSSRLNKSMDLQNTLLVMQGAMQAAGMGGPAMLAQMNLLGWIRLLANKAEIGSEVNELIVQDPQAYGAQLALMMMASQKGGPEAVLGAGGSEATGQQGDGGELSSPIAGGLNPGMMGNGGSNLGQMAGNFGGGAVG